MINRIALAALVAAIVHACPAYATLTSTSNTVSYVGNASTTTFTVPFKFLASTDLVVTVAGVTKVLNNDYTVRGAGNATGTVTFTTAPATSAAVVITRVVDYTQKTSLAQNRTPDPRTVESALDKLAMGEQQLQGLYTNPPATVLPANVTARLNGIRFADQFATIQAAVTDAGTTGAVIIPPGYAGTDTWTNPNNIPIADLRASGTGMRHYGVDARAWGAVCDGATDDSAKIATARAYAVSVGRPLYLPAGTCVVDSTALNYGNLTGNSPSSNIVLLGEGEQRTILKAKSAGQTMVRITMVTSGESNGIEIGRLGFTGFSASDVTPAHAIHITGAPSHLYLHDLRIRQFSGHGIFLPDQWHTLIADVSITDCGDNLFDIWGGNTTTLLRTYAMTVRAGRVGYRIHGGSVTMIGCNGINNIWGVTSSNTGFSEDQADWGIFGDATLTAWASTTAYTIGALRQNAGEEFEVITPGTSAGSGGPTTISKDITDGTVHWRHIGPADSPATHYFRGTLIGCNVEDFTRTGIRLKDNSSVNIMSTTFVPPPGAPATAAGLIAIWSQNQDPRTGPSFIDGQSFRETVFTQYDHSAPIQATTGSFSGFIQFGGAFRTLPGYSRDLQLTFNSPSITSGNCGGTGTALYNCILIPALSVSGAVKFSRTAPTYAASVSIDPTLGRFFDITATNGTAFTILTPGAGGSTGVGSSDGMVITQCIINTSGGALGALTFGGGYKLGAAWTQPATGFRRCIDFLYDGTSWHETYRSPADVAN